jgi:hypothetical protein
MLGGTFEMRPSGEMMMPFLIAEEPLLLTLALATPLLLPVLPFAGLVLVEFLFVLVVVAVDVRVGC